MKHFALLAIFGFLASAADAQLPPAPVGDPAHPETVIEFGEPEPVSIDTADGPVTFSALIADSDPERQRGLMFRESLADDEAMLFDYETVQTASIWMRNTLISLDIIFIDENGRIVKIVANAQPMTLRSNASDFPILGVLEVRGGLSRDAGIRPGDIVRHRIFGNVETETVADEADDATDDMADPAEEDTGEGG